MKMIIIAIFLIIIDSIIFILAEDRIKNKNNLLMLGFVVGMLSCTIISNGHIPKETQKYIENLEIKANMYEQSYDNFVYDDNMKQ